MIKEREEEFAILDKATKAIKVYRAVAKLFNNSGDISHIEMGLDQLKAVVERVVANYTLWSNMEDMSEIVEA